MRDFEDLILKVNRILNSLKILHCFTGGIATSYWGEPRTTMDIDVVWNPSDVDKLCDEFKKIGLTCDKSEFLHQIKEKENIVIEDKHFPLQN